MITSNIIEKIVTNKKILKLSAPLREGGRSELLVDLGRDIEGNQGNFNWICWCGDGVMGIKDRVLVGE
jgi:hypothetical protein